MSSATNQTPLFSSFITCSALSDVSTFAWITLLSPLTERTPYYCDIMGAYHQLLRNNGLRKLWQWRFQNIFYTDLGDSSSACRLWVFFKSCMHRCVYVWFSMILDVLPFHHSMFCWKCHLGLTKPPTVELQPELQVFLFMQGFCKLDEKLEFPWPEGMVVVLVLWQWFQKLLKQMC